MYPIPTPRYIPHSSYPQQLLLSRSQSKESRITHIYTFQTSPSLFYRPYQHKIMATQASGKTSVEDGVQVYRQYRLFGTKYENCCFHGCTIVDCILFHCKVFHCRLINSELRSVSLYETSAMNTSFDSECMMSRSPIPHACMNSLGGHKRRQFIGLFFKYTLAPEEHTLSSFRKTPPLLAALRVGDQTLYKEALLVYYRLSPFVLDSVSISTCTWLSAEALRHIHTLIIEYSITFSSTLR